MFIIIFLNRWAPKLTCKYIGPVRKVKYILHMKSRLLSIAYVFLQIQTYSFPLHFRCTQIHSLRVRATSLLLHIIRAELKRTHELQCHQLRNLVQSRNPHSRHLLLRQTRQTREAAHHVRRQLSRTQQLSKIFCFFNIKIGKILKWYLLYLSA